MRWAAVAIKCASSTSLAGCRWRSKCCWMRSRRSGQRGPVQSGASQIPSSSTCKRRGASVPPAPAQSERGEESNTSNARWCSTGRARPCKAHLAEASELLHACLPLCLALPTEVCVYVCVCMCLSLPVPLQECALMAALRHPNIVQFMGVSASPPAMITGGRVGRAFVQALLGSQCWGATPRWAWSLWKGVGGATARACIPCLLPRPP